MTAVRDLMRKNVVCAAPEQTVREVARTLSEQGISGMPVVTDSGDVLGVVSSTDVVRIAAESYDLAAASVRPLPEETEDELLASFFLPEETAAMPEAWTFGLEEDGPLDRLVVSDIMTPVSFSVAPDASVQELANFLVQGRIHRALVLEDGRLLGIVTTMDVLGALARGQV